MYNYSYELYLHISERYFNKYLAFVLYLREWIVQERLVCDEVQEGDAVLVEGQNVLGAILGLGRAADLERKTFT